MHNGMHKNENKNGSCLCVVLDSDDDYDERLDNSLLHDEMTMIYRNN